MNEKDGMAAGLTPDEQEPHQIESLHGKGIQHISHYASTEDEVLFRPGTRFEVLSRQEVNGVIQIFMREVP